MMKRIINIVVICSFLVTMFMPLNVKASSKTLQDFKNEVAAIQKEQNENKRLTSEAKASINSKRNAITNANKTITSNENKVEESKAELKKLIKKYNISLITTGTTNILY